MVRLSELTSGSSLALIVLRGYPGYQCPFCQRQVREFTLKAEAFAEAGVRLVFVYPGPADGLEARAKEALAGMDFPASADMLLDPGYTFTNLYGLRWEGPGETAYPSTFLIDPNGLVYFQKTARLHGGRTTVTEVLALLPKHKPRP